MMQFITIPTIFVIDRILEGLYQLCIVYNRIHMLTHLSRRREIPWISTNDGDNYRTSYRQQPASRCRSAALCKRKAASLVCTGLYVVGHTDCETDTTPTTRAYTYNSPGSQIMQVEQSRTLTHRPVCVVYAAKRRTVLASEAREESVSWLQLYFSHVKSAALCSIFKLSPLRVASLCASVPPCCSQTLRRSTTSDVGQQQHRRSAAQDGKTSRGSTGITLVRTYTAAVGCCSLSYMETK